MISTLLRQPSLKFVGSELELSTCSVKNKPLGNPQLTVSDSDNCQSPTSTQAPRNGVPILGVRKETPLPK
eukprot:1333064-Amphidinium_carterae.1